MKYEGIELKEITKPQVFDPPKEMLVWNSLEDVCVKKVYAIIKTGDGFIQAITIDKRWLKCAEIPEEPKPRRATNRELANWLAKGKGQILGTKISIIYDYDAGVADNGEVPQFFKVRKWEDIGWHEATVDYMEIK